MRIASIMPPRDSSGEDRLYWGLTSNGQFSTKSMYEALVQQQNNGERRLWLAIWRWRGPQRIRHTLWLAAWNRLLTNSERCRRHIAASSACDGCSGYEETSLHAIRDCFHASQVWNGLLRGNVPSGFFSLDLTSWLWSNLTNSLRVDIPNWDIIFGTAVWKLWLRRNARIFGGKVENNERLIGLILELAKSFKGVEDSLQGLMSRKLVRQWRNIGWQKPPAGYWKVNTDGAFSSTTGLASAGGLVRDERGVWICGFGMNIGFCSITGAELWGLFYGLQIAWDKGCRSVIVEMDSQAVVGMVMKRVGLDGIHGGLLRAIVELIDRAWDVSIVHEHREANFAADSLASLVAELSLGLHEWNTPSDAVKP